MFKSNKLKVKCSEAENVWISTKDNVNALACELRLLNFAHAGESKTAGEEVRFKTTAWKETIWVTRSGLWISQATAS